MGATGDLAARPSTGSPSLRPTLGVADLTLRTLGDSGTVLGELELAGRTLAEALAWQTSTLEAHLGRALSPPPRLREYDLPPHPVAGGAPWSGNLAAALAELARWLAFGERALRAFVAGKPQAAEIRCWPHHFDVGTIVSLEPEADPEVTPTVGLGLSPGDDSYAEPYFYVSFWPRPERAPSDPLPPGAHWHEEGFVAAILPGTSLVERKSARERETLVKSYLEESFRIFTS